MSNELDASPTPTATVIVPAYNAQDYVLEQLSALATQVSTRAIECIVIDDASIDRTAEIVRTWIDRTGNSPQFRLVTRRARGGPNAARNEGLRHARADFLLFTDGDDVVGAGWIDALLSVKDTESLLAGRNADLQERGADAESRSGVADWAPPRWGGWPFAFGNCMAGPRWIFERPGGFDENILIGGSETELAIRAQRQLGINVVGVPDALVWHRLPTTTTGWFRKHFARERGHAYIRRRHQGAAHRPSLRIGLAQIARGFGALATARASSTRSDALAHVARGAGTCLGSLWWGAVYWMRMPPPRLLGEQP